MRTSFNPAEPLISIQDVAHHFKLNQRTIYRWIKEPGFPCIHFAHSYRMRLGDVYAWLLDTYPAVLGRTEKEEVEQHEPITP